MIRGVRSFAGVFLAGVAATSSARGGQPYGVDVLPLRAALHQDARVLWLGDSYSLPMPARLSGGSLLSWRIDSWTAFSMGDGPSWFFVAYDVLDPAVSTIDAANGYRLYQTGPDAVVRYGLPLWRLREFHTADPAPDPIDVLRYRVLRQHVELGFHGPFTLAGQTANVRPIFLEPPGAAPALPALALTPEGGQAAWFDPRSQTRPKRVEGMNPESDDPVPPADGQVFAAPFDLPLTANSTGRLLYTLSAQAPADGERGYVFPAGLTAYRTENGQRVPGTHFSSLGDSSWDYINYGLDLPSAASPGVPAKSFTREQLAHWLDATSIDPAQPIYVFYVLSVEDIEPAAAAAQMEAMVDQTAGAAADAGLGPVHQCIVIPWLHRINGEDVLGRHEEQRDVAFALAASRPDVSAISIYDFTDGMMFDGSAESRQWLADNGFDTFTYGSITIDLSTESTGPNGGLLDIFRSHPANRDAGAFFAHIVERIFFEACPADFAPPHGLLDLADIQGFLTRFMAQAPSADLAPPFGVFDLADLSVFIDSFAAGCNGN